MNAIEFPDVLWFVNAVGNTTLKEESKVTAAQGCHIYEGTIDGAGIKIDIAILYLDNNSGSDGYPAALKFLRKNDVRQLVASDKLASKMTTINEYFKDHVRSIHTTTGYLFSIIYSDTKAYSDEVAKYNTDLFIPPLVKTSLTKYQEHANPIRAWLEDIDNDTRGKKIGSIGVLLAEPGQGKTFTAQCISSQLAKAKKILPVYIQSIQWKTLDRLDTPNLSKVITHSFACHHAPLPWVEGMEEKFISLFLKIGLLRIIFDGFDEYIYWNRGDLKPVEVLRTLSTLAEETGSKILITSRTSFWETEITPQNGFKNNENIVNFELLAFNREMSTEYFRRWFGSDDDKKRRANKVIDELNVRYQRDLSNNLAGRGYILYLVADLVNRTKVENAVDLGGKPALDWLFQELCARECTRQDLSLSALEQLSVLRTLCEFMTKGVMTRQSLETAIELVNDSLPPEQIEHNARLMGSHPLIRKVASAPEDEERWVFMHEQVHMSMLANHILEDFLAAEKGRRSHSRITASLQDIDYWESAVHAIYDIVLQAPRTGHFSSSLQEIIERFVILASAFPDAIIERYFATALALLATDGECGHSVSPPDRAKYFLSYFKPECFSNLYFSGPVHSFDFSGQAITKCSFDNVTFIRCKFDSNTEFNECKLAKVNHYQSEDFSIVKVNSSNYVDKQTRRLIVSGRIANGFEKYSNEHIHKDMMNALQVLVAHHNSGYKHITERELKKAIVAPEEIEDEFIKIFVSFTLMPQQQNAWHHSQLYALKPEIDVALRQYIESGALTGLLARCEKTLSKSLQYENIQ